MPLCVHVSSYTPPKPRAVLSSLTLYPSVKVSRSGTRAVPAGGSTLTFRSPERPCTSPQARLDHLDRHLVGGRRRNVAGLSVAVAALHGKDPIRAGHGPAAGAVAPLNSRRVVGWLRQRIAHPELGDGEVRRHSRVEVANYH